jgi:chloramphenicol O-acetyltransferase type A
MKKWIDFKSWPRYQHYQFFQSYEIPRYNMTFPIDVTILYQSCKATNTRFYFALMHRIIYQLNLIENFRYRIQDGKVFDETIDFVSFTDLIEHTELFKMVFVPVNHNPILFEREAVEASKRQGSTLINLDNELVLNTVYVTSFPWAQFTHLTHATKLGNTDSVPRISWSQFVDVNGRKTLNLSVEAHHGLVDGIHLGKFINHLQASLNKI